MNKIKFSIITPTFNRLESGFLELCIESVQNQIGNNFEFEHIIINDASTDNTNTWLKEACKNYDNLVLFSNKKNIGVAKNFELGIKCAKNDYLIILEDDDLLPLDSLRLRANYAQSNPNTDWFYGKGEWIDCAGNNVPVTFQSEFPADHIYERALIRNLIHGGTPTIKRSAASLVKWPEWLTRSQDYYFWLELLKPENKLTVGFIDQTLYIYRRHGGSFSNTYETNAELGREKWLITEELKRKSHPESLSFMAVEARRYQYQVGRLESKLQKLESKILELQESAS